MRISRLPEVDRTNGWSASLAQRQAKPALQGERTADWVVLGAGYAGLAAARRLAKNCPDNHIVLIDAGTVGENASGRNSGFAIERITNRQCMQDRPVFAIDMINARRHSSVDVTLTLKHSQDLSTWETVPLEGSPDPTGNGSATHTYTTGARSGFFQVEATLQP